MALGFVNLILKFMLAKLLVAFCLLGLCRPGNLLFEMGFNNNQEALKEFASRELTCCQLQLSVFL
jgi:hypothetical protein